MMSVGGLKLTLVHEDIQAAPEYKLPTGYYFEWFSSGKEDDWVKIHEDAENYLEVDYACYKKSFGTDQDDLKSRQLFLYDSKRECIGTGSAWYGFHTFGSNFGRVHWVAIKKKSQGLGLSYPIVSEVMQRLISLGYKAAYLTTSAHRFAAIKTYLKFGFKPFLADEENMKAWKEYLELTKKVNG